ncbi:unnamed protein product [Pleuronectes platessa]|uniref:Uncharacterized protein n=1 Tax=Pleuronectes platessa TaxID=8262 RepID=A0A9N7YRD1_PLEPL|nr:unnamed protein product [Pleuronectes platessa]
MSTVPKTLEKINSRDLLWFLYVRNDTLDGVEWDYDPKIRHSLAKWPRTTPHHNPPGSGERRPGSPAFWLVLARELTRSALSPGRRRRRSRAGGARADTADTVQ